MAKRTDEPCYIRLYKNGRFISAISLQHLTVDEVMDMLFKRDLCDFDE